MTQEQPTIKEIVSSVGWLSQHNDDIGLEFDSADWSTVEEDGVIRVEGQAGDYVIYAKFQLVSYESHYSPDEDFGDLYWDESEEDDEDEEE